MYLLQIARNLLYVHYWRKSTQLIDNGIDWDALMADEPSHEESANEQLQFERIQRVWHELAQSVSRRCAYGEKRDCGWQLSWRIRYSKTKSDSFAQLQPWASEISERAKLWPVSDPSDKESPARKNRYRIA